ncbi:MAG: tRNA (N6-isopentenyl adenosine(37)-C2)-methylthiotransferase MiaB [Desulfobacterales bacterium]|nr:tRNA (N6-isopentenyl adenosine(37)-C2)-methylthiotransferase MiaB [Desulfobacterales bacterium]
MTVRHLYMNTIGCQMNVYDTERIVGGLAELGYRLTETPETADLIIMNTCAIREKAEQKVFSFLGRLEKLKRKKPGLIIGVGGCVAQQEGESILRRVPFLDLVFGVDAIGRVPAHIQRIESRRNRVVDVKMNGDADAMSSAPISPANRKIARFVTIMQGCDNYCTYCVVPYVRGREKSRSPGRIIAEVRDLAEAGAREITLLGQNVNSYGRKEGMCSFPDLLARLNDVEGIDRIRFTTSHPKDLSDALIGAFGTLGKLCRHIHLPVQSGSNRILKRMNRKYTRERYLEKIDKLRQARPDIAITSDIIAGFPGEERKDFLDTLDLIRRVEFDGLFAFKYSDRPNASAARFSGKIPEREKKDRLKEILDLQQGFTLQKHEALVGSRQRVLVEGLSKKQTSEPSGAGVDAGEGAGLQWSGRTTGNKIVNFSHETGATGNIGGIGEIGDMRALAAPPVETGIMVDVLIERAFPHSLWGRLPRA